METVNKKASNLVAAYRRYMKLERNFTPNTLDAYSHDIEKLLAYFGEQGIDPLAARLSPG